MAPQSKAERRLEEWLKTAEGEKWLNDLTIKAKKWLCEQIAEDLANELLAESKRGKRQKTLLNTPLEHKLKCQY